MDNCGKVCGNLIIHLPNSNRVSVDSVHEATFANFFGKFIVDIGKFLENARLKTMISVGNIPGVSFVVHK